MDPFDGMTQQEATAHIRTKRSEIDQLESKYQRHLVALDNAKKIKVQCEDCEGTGEVRCMSWHDNADIETSDCSLCGGDGWVYATPWTGSP